ncbi:MAG TPA: ABC transporter ATP-binding protein [Ramlibacter sp.]|uniref:ABC transporter ATP-binding protein n=1 Tax=Ramlibacter sp. TaxID=1917967 RepID=UPI002C489EBE|nr:ABC transporter ATP-binding protein [Ramlibacter sp.]HVZ44060.1 ABC transporter ATP-binding protein [Ramlibacter sp.]
MLQLNGLRHLEVGPVDLRVEDSECVAIEGRSGSGKSVLLRTIADLDPHTGDASLDGVACSAMPAPRWRQQVTYVAADSGWWADRVEDHFVAGDGLQALLARVGLPSEAAQWPVSRLSTGERQRAALLRALTPANRVLLLDEPTSGLDLETREQVEALLRERMGQGASVLLVTHDADLAKRLAHRRFEMDRGQLREMNPHDGRAIRGDPRKEPGNDGMQRDA